MIGPAEVYTYIHTYIHTRIEKDGKKKGLSSYVPQYPLRQDIASPNTYREVRSCPAAAVLFLLSTKSQAGI